MATSAASIGMVLAGRYRLDAALGQGGMGSVFAATDILLERVVAVKVVHVEASGGAHSVDARNLAERLSRFALEAKAVASLTHPHVCGLYDFHAAMDPVAFLVMERVEGESLRALLGREGRLPPARAVEIARQVLSALSAAHARGTIHRDIKPSNVMLARGPGLDTFVKVVDFGVARMSDDVARGHRTALAAVIGTPQYMPPEQAAGLPVTSRADLYAVGVCLYEMLAGTSPFAVGDASAILQAVRTVVPRSLEQLRPDVSPALATVVNRALAKRAEDRWPSATDMEAALGVALGQGGTAAPFASTMLSSPSVLGQGPASMTRLDPVPAGRPRSRAGLGLALVLVPLLVLGVAAAFSFRAETAAAPGPIPSLPVALASVPDEQPSSGVEPLPPLSSASSVPVASAPARTVPPHSQAERAAERIRMGDYPGARAILEPRIRVGTATREERQMLRTICRAQGDAACVRRMELELAGPPLELDLK